MCTCMTGCMAACWCWAVRDGSLQTGGLLGPSMCVAQRGHRLSAGWASWMSSSKAPASVCEMESGDGLVVCRACSYVACLAGEAECAAMGAENMLQQRHGIVAQLGRRGKRSARLHNERPHGSSKVPPYSVKARFRLMHRAALSCRCQTWDKPVASQSQKTCASRTV